MSATQRSMLAARADLASVRGADLIDAADRIEAGPAAQVISHITQLSMQANSALMRGDSTRYFELVAITDNFTLMSPFGGAPSRAFEYTADRIETMGRFFRNGTFRQELVQAYACPDMVVLATIERPHVEVGGLPAQDWALRVTLVYRRQGSHWRLAHRHADPLVAGVSVVEAAALARGEGASPKQ